MLCVLVSLPNYLDSLPGLDFIFIPWLGVHDLGIRCSVLGRGALAGFGGQCRVQGIVGGGFRVS